MEKRETGKNEKGSYKDYKVRNISENNILKISLSVKTGRHMLLERKNYKPTEFKGSLLSIKLWPQVLKDIDYLKFKATFVSMSSRSDR